MSPAAPNPKRDEMENLMRQGMSRDEAYEKVFGVKPENLQTRQMVAKPSQQHSIPSAHFAQQIETGPGADEGLVALGAEDNSDAASGSSLDNVEFASTAARELADEEELSEADFEGEEGSGANGGFTKDDVAKIVESKASDE